MSPQIDEEAIFDIARRIDSAAARSDYLQQVCGDNTALLARVEGLLQMQDAEPEFLVGPPSFGDPTAIATPMTEGPGTKIAHYRLMEQIGEGGFGVVYVAEQERPVRRKVALKVIKPGMDTKEVIARFEAERQALAMMDHHHIAKVLDAGATDSGRPYFVMELVRGIPITDYCQKKRLNTQRRLELFVLVCQAMQHAHQKGVIHRDVKPSNVLITERDGSPMPKIIDFGVAKAIHQRLTERTIYTRHQQIVGTPLYMSPEQAELSALDVDTRTDIYSLGVLLYELLTGTTPIDRQRMNSSAYDEIRRIIREEDPPKPSTRVNTLATGSHDSVEGAPDADFKRLSSLLRGDLDWIVMKSLEKDRSLRYESASALGDDIRRHLSNEPVLASPPSAIYRFRKFVRRRKGLVFAGSAVTAALVLGLATTLMALIEANRQRALVESANQATLQALASTEKQRIIAIDAQAQADKNAAAALRERDIAEQQRKLVASQHAKTSAVLALIEDMLRSPSRWYRRDMNRPFPSGGSGVEYTVRDMLDDFSQSIDQEFSGNPEVGADVWKAIASSYHVLGEIAKSHWASRKSIELGKQAYDVDEPGLYRYLERAAYWLLIHPGISEHSILNAAEAEALFREAIEAAGRLPEDSLVYQRQVGLRNFLANSIQRQGRYDEAEQILLSVIENDEDDWGKPLSHTYLAWGIINSGSARQAEAIFHADEAIRLGADDPDDLMYLYALLAKGVVYLMQSRISEADACFAATLSSHPAGFPNEQITAWDQDFIRARSRTLVSLGKSEEAKRTLEGALAVSRKTEASYHEAMFLTTLADIAVCEGDYAVAERLLLEAVETIWNKYGPHDILYSRQQRYLAQIYELSDQRDKADAVYETMIPVITRGVDQSGRNWLWLVELAWAKSHDSASDERDIQTAIKAAQQALKSAETSERNVLQASLATAQHRLGRSDEAIDTLKVALQQRDLRLHLQWLPVEKLKYELLVQRGLENELQVAMRDAAAYQEAHLGDTHTMTLETKTKLVDWLVRVGRPEEAAEFVDDCVALVESDTTPQRKRFAIATLLRRAEALKQEADIKKWRTLLEQVDTAHQ